LYFFGGKTMVGNTEVVTNDLWILTIGNKPLEWIKPELAGTPPEPRYLHTMNFFEEGNYLNDQKNGPWKYHYTNGKLNFEGNFRDGEPDGKHKFYYDNGKLKKEEVYVMGIKSNTWKLYNELGELTLTIYFKNGVEYKIDGTTIKE